jgi:hypothetical protein
VRRLRNDRDTALAAASSLGDARQVRRRLQVSLAAAGGGAVLVAVVAAAGTPSAPGAAPPGARPGVGGPAAPPVPARVADCWVPDATGTISLTLDEAMHLSTVAAGLLDRPRRASRLRAAVESTLDVTSTQAAAATGSILADPGTPRLTCAPARLGVEPETIGRNGLTPRARRLRAAWTEVFGPLPAGGFARGGVSSGHVDSSSHYDGRAVDVFFRPHDDDEQRRAGRVFAQWLVAHAQEHHVLSVIYADRIWTSWAAYAGWRDYVHPSGDTRNPVLRHLDHVHVAVESGRPYRP